MLTLVFGQLLGILHRSFRFEANEPNPGLTIDLLRKEPYELINLEILDSLQPILPHGGRDWRIPPDVVIDPTDNSGV